MTFLFCLLLLGVNCSFPQFCPGVPADFAERCNSDIENDPPKPFSFSMGASETATYAAEALDTTVAYPAAFVEFTNSNPTIVRVWDAFWSGDFFQITLSGNAFPTQNPAFFPSVILNWYPYTQSPAAFQNPAYAWTEFILMEPSTWKLNISVTRAVPLEVRFIGNYVQQYIQTLPYIPPTSCPF